MEAEDEERVARTGLRVWWMPGVFGALFTITYLAFIALLGNHILSEEELYG